MIKLDTPYRLVDLLDTDYDNEVVGYYPNLLSAIGAYYAYQQASYGFCILSIEQNLPCIGWHDITHELKQKGALL